VNAYTLSDFDFELPAHLIAQHPLPTRTASRLLDGSGQNVIDRQFTDLPQLLNAGDLLVFNDTQVVKARFWGEKPTGGKVELLVERVLEGNQVIAHMRVSKKMRDGAVLRVADAFDAQLLGRWPDETGSMFRLRFDDLQGRDPYALMQAYGDLPLPPYIERQAGEADSARYQTVFAKTPGAVAAPTAALHFDEDLLLALQRQGVALAYVTLHVGAGTFMPVKSEDINQHAMHHERYWVPEGTQQAIHACKARGGRVVAVGTTTVRTLESWALSSQAEGDTNIFIRPGFQFRLIDALITNFHLPKSTLLMLVSAFTGYTHMHRLYRHAIAAHYRFFSYGDAMFLTRASTAPANGAGVDSA
jgi:S-adenosylmethionine:tRNA ribosyltransferase-isomerase